MPFAPLAGDVPQGAGERGADILQKELKNQSDFEVIPRQEVSSNTAVKALSLATSKLQEARQLEGQHKTAAAVKDYQAALDSFGKASAELENFVRDGVVTYWHQSCTARMGRDAMAVVDGELRVYGVDNLRVADGSIMPRVTTGNTQAACVVIGERAAHALRVEHKLETASADIEEGSDAAC